MKKWIAALLTLVMLAQALPWTAFADAVAAGQMITDTELQLTHHADIVDRCP